MDIIMRHAFDYDALPLTSSFRRTLTPLKAQQQQQQQHQYQPQSHANFNQHQQQHQQLGTSNTSACWNDSYEQAYHRDHHDRVAANSHAGGGGGGGGRQNLPRSVSFAASALASHGDDWSRLGPAPQRHESSAPHAFSAFAGSASSGSSSSAFGSLADTFDRAPSKLLRRNRSGGGGGGGGSSTATAHDDSGDGSFAVCGRRRGGAPRPDTYASAAPSRRVSSSSAAGADAVSHRRTSASGASNNNTSNSSSSSSSSSSLSRRSRALQAENDALWCALELSMGRLDAVSRATVLCELPDALQQSELFTTMATRLLNVRAPSASSCATRSSLCDDDDAADTDNSGDGWGGPRRNGRGGDVGVGGGAPVRVSEVPVRSPSAYRDPRVASSGGAPQQQQQQQQQQRERRRLSCDRPAVAAALVLNSATVSPAAPAFAIDLAGQLDDAAAAVFRLPDQSPAPTRDRTFDERWCAALAVAAAEDDLYDFRAAAAAAVVVAAEECHGGRRAASASSSASLQGTPARTSAQQHDVSGFRAGTPASSTVAAGAQGHHVAAVGAGIPGPKTPVQARPTSSSSCVDADGVPHRRRGGQRRAALATLDNTN